MINKSSHLLLFFILLLQKDFLFFIDEAPLRRTAQNKNVKSFNPDATERKTLLILQ